MDILLHLHSWLRFVFPVSQHRGLDGTGVSIQDICLLSPAVGSGERILSAPFFLSWQQAPRCMQVEPTNKQTLPPSQVPRQTHVETCRYTDTYVQRERERRRRKAEARRERTSAARGLQNLFFFFSSPSVCSTLLIESSLEGEKSNGTSRRRTSPPR